MKRSPMPLRKESLRDATARKQHERTQDTTPPDRGREKRSGELARQVTVRDPRKARTVNPVGAPKVSTREQREQLDALTTAFLQETYEACEHRCANCGYEGPHLQAHHVVGQNTIKRHYGTIQELWSSDNGLLLCAEPAPNRCHQRHELAVARIPRDRLRAENEAFAEAFGFGWYLERYYAESR